MKEIKLICKESVKYRAHAPPNKCQPNAIFQYSPGIIDQMRVFLMENHNIS